ncbi:MAG: hypothetical protein H6Q15_812 [Bacteroidetes bacterium]|nr:hypothetical protein [Bacteroidota bacterium]
MKKLLLLLFIFISIGVNSQSINWGERIKLKDHSSVYDYIGSIDGTSYYSYGYRATGFMGRFDRIGIMSKKNNNTLNFSPEYIEISYHSLISTFVTEEGIGVVFTEEDGRNDKNEVKCIMIDRNTLKQKSEKVLLSNSLTRKDDASVNFYQSQDKSLFAISYLNNNSKNGSYFTFDVYDNELKKMWSNKYETEIGGDISFLDIELSNYGEIYILSRHINNKHNKVGISKITEEERTENSFDIDIEINDAEIKVIDTNKVYIALNDKIKFVGITYDLEQEELTNKVSFEYKKEKGTYWGIKDILQLENGKLVVVCEDTYVLIVTGRSNYNTYYNRNFYAICVNPEIGKIEYNQLISKSTCFTNGWPSEGGQFEKQFYFTKGNNFYAIYNTSRKDDELCGEIFIDPGITFPSSSNKIISNMLTINESGKPKVDILFSQEEDELNFSPNITNEVENGKISIGGFDGKYINFGTLNVR